MYEGLSWLIIVGSGFDGWVYWHFFTITPSEWITTSAWWMFYEEFLEFTNELPFITAREQNKDHRLQVFHYCSSGMRWLGNVHEPLPNKTDNSVSGSNIPVFRPCLPSRCLANDFFLLFATETCVSETLSGNGLFRLSGLISLYKV
jgi:hypothetical protein